MNTAPSPQLIRTVGFWGLVLMCINAVIGSGVFLLPYESYTLLGPFSLWAPILFAIPVFILVLCFAEAASHFEQPGGAYLYARTAFGDFIGFQTGWMNWLARVTSLASLSNAFVLALGLLYPTLSIGAPRAAIIIAMIVILGAIHFIGVRQGAASIYILTMGKLIPLLGFIVISLVVWKSNPLPASFTLPQGDTNWINASLFMLFAYAGFENVGVPAGEYKNPRKDLPIALLIGTLAIAAIYALVQLGAMSALGDLSQSKTPIATAASALIGPAGAIIVTIGALLSMAGTNSGTMLEGSRMLYSLARDRRLGPISFVHPRFHTPTVAIFIHSIAALIIALAGSFAQLALLSTVARLATYLATCLALPRLRKLSPGFRTRGLLVPILGTGVSLIFIVNLDGPKVIAATLALVVGCLIYLLSRPTHTKTSHSERSGEERAT
jgi:APA family basic amino acid/polyamine antiporter